MVEVKQSIESNEENRKTEKINRLEIKLTAAEQKREQELQRKLEKIKENVCIPCLPICNLFLVLMKTIYLLRNVDF